MSAYNKKGLRKKSLLTDKEGRRLSEAAIPSTPVSGMFNMCCLFTYVTRDPVIHPIYNSLYPTILFPPPFVQPTPVIPVIKNKQTIY